MNQILVITCSFIFINVIYLLIILRNSSNYKNIPQYINSSIDPEYRYENNSLLLTSMKNSMKNIFNYNPILNSKKANLNDKLIESELIMINKNKKNSNKKFISQEIVNKIKNSKNINKKFRNLILQFLRKLGKNIENVNKNKLSHEKALETQINNNIIITESSKFTLFYDHEKKYVYILRISNDGEIFNKFDDKAGEVSLYSLPMDIFLKNESKENIKKTFENKILENSLIKKCWNSKFFGKIVGSFQSNDKKNLAITYEFKEEDNFFHRIRYFNDLYSGCFSKTYSHEFNIYENNLMKYFINNKTNETASNKNFNRVYFEISEFSKENFFNDNFYDDFSIGINHSIKSMAVRKNSLVYTTDTQLYQYTVLKRQNSESKNKIVWKVSSLGPKKEKNLKFFFTNSLKFSENSENEYHIIQIITCGFSNSANKDLEILRLGKFRIQQEINFVELNLNQEVENSYIIEIIEEKLNEIKSFVFYKLDLSASHISEKFNISKQTLFSNNNLNNNDNSQNFLMEINQSELILLNSIISQGQLNLMKLIPDSKEKIESIYSDQNNSNILIVKIIFDYNLIFFFN